MTTEADYRQRIQTFDHAAIVELWQAVRRNDTPDWQAGRAFEYLVLRAFQIEGATVRYPYSVSIEQMPVEQLDGAVHSDGISCIIECKDQTTNVDFAAVAQLRTRLMRRPPSAVGVLFSRSGFTAPTIKLSHFVASETIILWDGEQFNDALVKRRLRTSLIAKYRRLIEDGAAYYDTRVDE